MGNKLSPEEKVLKEKVKELLQLFPMQEGQTVELKDGRKIGYCEYGDPSGKYTAIFIPGLPGSRFFCPDGMNQKASELGIRMLVVERPGLGLSSPHPTYKLLDFADDIDQFTDILNIPKFSLIGYSAGGPGAQAVLYKLKHKVVSAAIVSSVCPPGAPNVTKRMPVLFKVAYWAAGNFVPLLKAAAKSSEGNYRKDPVAEGRESFSIYCKEDYEEYKKEEIELLFLKSALELYSRKQSDAELHEYTLWRAPWGFDLKDVECKYVSVYQGKKDFGTTYEMGEFIHKNIKDSQFKVHEDKGHLLFFSVYNEILEDLLKAYNVQEVTNNDNANNSNNDSDDKKNIEQ